MRANNRLSKKSPVFIRYIHRHYNALIIFLLLDLKWSKLPKNWSELRWMGNTLATIYRLPAKYFRKGMSVPIKDAWRAPKLMKHGKTDLRHIPEVQSVRKPSDSQNPKFLVTLRSRCQWKQELQKNKNLHMENMCDIWNTLLQNLIP